VARGSLSLRLGFRDELDDTMLSARLGRELDDSTRRRSSLDELSLLPVKDFHMMVVNAAMRALQD
jgi:hypothetical protein